MANQILAFEKDRGNCQGEIVLLVFEKDFYQVCKEYKPILGPRGSSGLNFVKTSDF